MILASCSRAVPVKEEDLIGTWVRTSGDSTCEWTFEIDGRYKEKVYTDNDEKFEMEDSGKYVFEDGSVTVTFETYGTSAQFKVKMDGDTMTLSNDDVTYTFEKK